MLHDWGEMVSVFSEAEVRSPRAEERVCLAAGTEGGGGHSEGAHLQGSTADWLRGGRENVKFT